MITYVKGSLFESPAKVLVNTVNVVGVMGKGIAKVFKQVYPEMFKRYQHLCEDGKFTTGQLWLYKTPHKWILNFPTKKHWRSPSRLEFIEAGLQKFVDSYSKLGITSIAFPHLGCGNGELDWERAVHPLMEKFLANLPIDTFIHEHGGPAAVPEHRDIESMREWLRSQPRSLAFDEVWQDLREVIGKGLVLEPWEGSGVFRISMVESPLEGLSVTLRYEKTWRKIAEAIRQLMPSPIRPTVIADGWIFVPREAILDLWQGTRSYGYCVPRLMPAELEPLAPHIMSLLSKLTYLRPVEMMMDGQAAPYQALQLFTPTTIATAATAKHAERVHAV